MANIQYIIYVNIYWIISECRFDKWIFIFRQEGLPDLRQGARGARDDRRRLLALRSAAGQDGRQKVRAESRRQGLSEPDLLPGAGAYALHGWVLLQFLMMKKELQGQEPMHFTGEFFGSYWWVLVISSLVSSWWVLLQLLMMKKELRLAGIDRQNTPIHWENYPISFHIEWDMIVVTVFLSILNQMEVHLVQN